MAVRKFFNNNLNEKDSVLISVAHADTFFRVLVAVYNATSLPARDTVVNLLHIHTSIDYDLNEILRMPTDIKIGSGYISRVTPQDGQRIHMPYRGYLLSNIQIKTS